MGDKAAALRFRLGSEQAVERILDMPDGLRAFAIFPYGYAAEEKQQADRFDESRIHYVT